MKRISIMPCIFLMVLFIMCVPEIQQPDQTTRPLGAIFAHRGASGLAPENTLAAIERAIGFGADGVEVDVHQTKDSVLVIIHDNTIDRTTGGTGRVMDLTFAQIRQYSAGHWFDDQFAGEKVPSLDEVLALVNGRSRLLIEIKGGGDTYPGIEERVVRAIHSRDARDWCSIQSFHHKTLMVLHRMDSTLSLYKLVMYDMPGFPIYIDSGIQFGWLRENDFVEAISVNRNSVTETLVTSLHKYGLKVYVWTVDDFLDMVHLFRIGVDGIITNFPNFKERINAGTMQR
jgi:glycerophosphoryl diester phosphodiesterase